MSDDGFWKTSAFRQSAVSKIEEEIKQSGMNTSRNSLEMENHVFQKAKSKEEYLGYVAKLILHVREMNTKNGAGMGVTGTSQGASSVPDPVNDLQTQAIQGTHNPVMTMDGPQEAPMGATNQLQTLNCGPAQAMGAMQQNLQTQPNIDMEPNGGPLSNQISETTNQMENQLAGQMQNNGTNQMPNQMSNQLQEAVQNQIDNQMQIPLSGQLQMGGPMQNSIGGAMGNQIPNQILNQIGDNKPVMMTTPNSEFPRNSTPNECLRQSPSPSVQSPAALRASPPGIQIVAIPALAPSPGSQMSLLGAGGPSRSVVMVPSPGSSLNTPGQPNQSPVGMQDEQAYHEKVRQLRKYIKPLRKMISRVRKNGTHVEPLRKMTNLVDVLSDPHKKMPLEALKKYEVILKKFDCKRSDGSVPTSSSAHLPIKEHHVFNPLLEAVSTYIRSCEAFELALKGHDDDNDDIRIEPINFTAQLDSVLTTCLKDAKIFEGTSKMIQNELLDAIFAVYRTELIEQIRSAKFIALQVNEATNASKHQQMIVIIRYVLNGQICERFWSFINPVRHTAGELASALITELQHILLPLDNFKLIAQSYEGAPFTVAKNYDIHTIIQKAFPYAYFVHCYTHQINLIIEQAAQCHKEAKIFFANLQSFSNFFSQWSKCTSVVDEVIKRNLPPTCWNSKSQTLNTLLEYKDSFIDCLEKILAADGIDAKTINEACSLLNHLKHPEFIYWLKIFHSIMPHMEQFEISLQAQKTGIESLQLQRAVKQFEETLMHIRSSIDHMESAEEELPKKKQKVVFPEYSKCDIAKNMCDNIVVQIKRRFDFTDHLSAAKLLDSKNFKIYQQIFPQEYFDATVKSYSMLDSAKLRSELDTIYERDDLCDLDGILPLLGFLSDNCLNTDLPETYKLLDIICTTPMLTSESARCFSTLKRIKTFLRSAVSEDRLNALAVLTTEKEFIQDISNFDNKVIDMYCSDVS